jgi:hypothetical protein
MRYLVAKAVGLNSDQEAALNYYLPLEEDLFLAVLNISCDDAFTRGRQLLTDLGDFFISEEGSVGERLTTTFTKAIKELEGAEFNILLVALSNKAMYLVKQGQMDAFLKRQGKISPLLEVNDGQLISGFLTPGDRVLLTTVNLAQMVKGDLSQVMSLDTDSFEEEMALRLNSGDFDSNGLAGLLIRSEEPAEPLENIEVAESKVKKFSFKLPNKLPTLPMPAISVSFGRRGKLILAAVMIGAVLIGIGLKFKSVKSSQDATKKEQQIEASKPPEISQKFDISFSDFLDLDLVKKGFSATSMSLSDDKLLLLDLSTKTLVLIDLSKKSNQILAGRDQLGDATLISLNGSLAFSYSLDKGIVRVDSGNLKVTTVAKPDKELGKVSDIYAFGGNVYVLDSLSNQIWKYVPTESGYSDKRKYLEEGVKVDFAGSKRMQIESSVYILGQNGEISRFTKGSPDNLSIGGLDKGIKDPKNIFVSSETDNLYVLDSGNSRLVVLSKTGEYKAQYLGDRFSSATDLVVDEIGKEVYILDGSKIYQIELK